MKKAKNTQPELLPNPETAGAIGADKQSPPIPEGMMLVSESALSEIRVTLHDCLETAINICLECSQTFDSGDAANLIRPAVERLEAICRENNFPE
jgi:hypothetical protein